MKLHLATATTSFRHATVAITGDEGHSLKLRALPLVGNTDSADGPALEFLGGAGTLAAGALALLGQLGALALGPLLECRSGGLGRENRRGTAR